MFPKRRPWGGARGPWPRRAWRGPIWPANWPTSTGAARPSEAPAPAQPHQAIRTAPGATCTRAGYNRCVPKTPPTLYLLHGDDEIAMRETIARLFEQLGEASMRDLNTTRLEGRGLSLAALGDSCGTAPFLARRPLGRGE